jgi:hypothetical protein
MVAHARGVVDTIVQMAFTLHYMLYFMVVRSALVIFVCRPDATGIDRLAAEPSFECWVGAHQLMVTWATVSLLVYGVGFPCTMAAVVYRCVARPRSRCASSARGLSSTSFGTAACRYRYGMQRGGLGVPARGEPSRGAEVRPSTTAQEVEARAVYRLYASEAGAVTVETAVAVAVAAGSGSPGQSCLCCAGRAA